MTAAAVRARRLFFALWPDPAVREALRRETRAAVRHCGGRPVPPENFHLTVAFLGNVPEERLDALLEAVRALVAPPVGLCLDRYGWFEAPQVLWIGCATPPPVLGQLARDLWQRLGGVAGLAADARPFHPHVTLARKVRNPPDLPPPRPVAWTARGLALVESVTDPAGARYEVLAELPFSG